ncbi:MAG: hypothetical protein K2K60_07335 [Clostridia bacterium]|nr:hypothetical protein [Clostridia bacterium]
MEDIHTCENCRYYLAHYINRHGTYFKVASGHCTNRSLDLKESRKRIKKSLPCEFWQTIEIQKEERRESIKEVLRSMAQRLDEFIQILKDDE